MHILNWEDNLPTAKLKYRGEAFNVSLPNGKAVSVAKKFSEKLDSMADWVDEFVNPDDLVFDVGANYGILSLYAATKAKCRVISFEPQISSFYILFRNIVSNKLLERVFPFQLALTTSTGFSRNFELADMTAGRAMNTLTLQNSSNQDVKILNQIQDMKSHLLDASRSALDQIKFFQTVQTTSLDTFVSLQSNLVPDKANLHLKIDVDGLDFLVLAGAFNTLTRVKSIYIEFIPDLVNLSSLIPIFCSELGFEIYKEESGNLILLNHKTSA